MTVAGSYFIAAQETREKADIASLFDPPEH
jgi:hypothetical protein